MADELKSLVGTTLPEKFTDKTTYAAQVYDIATTKSGGLIDSSTLRLVNGKYATYSAAFDVVPVAGCTDLVEIIGAAGKTIEITSIRLAGITSAGTRSHLFSLIRRSAVNTGGTSTNATLVPHSSTNSASSATIKVYTANPASLGTAVATLNVERVSMNLSTSTTYRTPFDLVVNPTPVSTMPIKLKSATDTLCVNLNGMAIGTISTMCMAITYREY